MTQTATLADILPTNILMIEPLRERTVSARLTERGFDPYCPQHLRTEKRGGNLGNTKVRHVIRPLFPGYMFLQLPPGPGQIEAVMVPGVRDFLRRPGGTLAFATPAEMLLVREKEAEALLLPSKRPASGYKKGQRVEILQGPWQAFMGPIEKLDTRDRISVLLNVFGRLTPVTVKAHEIRAA